MRLLIVINPQIDFCEGGALEIPGAAELLNITAKEASNFDKVICLKEWHPANHVSFAANHPWRYPGQKIEFHGRQLMLTISHCVQDQFGALIHSAFKTIEFDAVVELGKNELIETDAEILTVFQTEISSIINSNSSLEKIKFVGLVHNGIADELMALVQTYFPNVILENSSILKYKAPKKT